VPKPVDGNERKADGRLVSLTALPNKRKVG